MVMKLVLFNHFKHFRAVGGKFWILSLHWDITQSLSQDIIENLFCSLSILYCTSVHLVTLQYRLLVSRYQNNPHHQNHWYLISEWFFLIRKVCRRITRNMTERCWESSLHLENKVEFQVSDLAARTSSLFSSLVRIVLCVDTFTYICAVESAVG